MKGKGKDNDIIVQFDMKCLKRIINKARKIKFFPGYSPELEGTAKGVIAEISAKDIGREKLNSTLEDLAICLGNGDMVWQLRKDKKQKKPRVSALFVY